MNINYCAVNESRTYILNKIQPIKKSNANFKVIDIGGTVTGWSQPIVDFVVDINSTDDSKNFKFDICSADQWNKLKNYVALYGKFDYCICTHTLEDLYNPVVTLDILPLIAHAGVITMPSAKTELSHIESQEYLGYIHHRWLFGVEDGRMVVAPKLNFLDSLVRPGFNQRTEIRYEWEQYVSYKMFMNNYLGPTVDHVVNSYKLFLSKQ